MNPSELIQIIELYNKMDYDQNLEINNCNTENQQNLSEGYSFENVHNPELNSADYIKFLQENRSVILSLEQCENFKNSFETLKHIDLSIKYLKAFNDADYKISEKLDQSFCLIHNIPLYEFILSCFKIIKYYRKSTVATDARRRTLLELFLKGNYKSNLPSPQNIEIDETRVIDRYTSMVVYDTSDIETATDLISNSFHENSVPWKIRDLYVQESILDRFTTSLKSKLKPFEACYREDNQLTDRYVTAIALAKKMGLKLITNDLDKNEMKPTIIAGQNRSYFDKEANNIPLIINLNVFRTVKESIDMINRNINLSISLWTENISAAYEFISKVNTNCIWINSNGVFNTKMPFPFNQLILKNLGATSNNASLGIREQEGNIEFHCYEVGDKAKSYPSQDLSCNITKTIFVNSVKVCFYIDTSILSNEEDYLNFISLGNFKTVVIPFGVTFGN